MISRTGNRQHQDPAISHAEDVIFSTYGDVVRVSAKKKDLLKFGSIKSTAGTSEQTVAEFQGSTIRETYATTNSIDYLVCEDNAFTGNVLVEGHSISGSDLTFVSQIVAATGNTPAALSNPIARTTRGNIPGAVGLAATTDRIFVYDATAATGTTSGVPDVAAATKLIINGDENQSEKGATSISSVDYWIVTGMFAGIAKKTSASATIRLRSRIIPNVFRTIAPKLHLDADGATEVNIVFSPPLIIPKNSDVEITIEGSASAIECSAGLVGYLAVIV
jgi:hypothetical protein